MLRIFALKKRSVVFSLGPNASAGLALTAPAELEMIATAGLEMIATAGLANYVAGS